MKGPRRPLAELHGPDKPLWARLIRAARVARGWSQADLEEAANLSKIQVYRADRGRNAPSRPTARALREALDIPMEVMEDALSGEPGSVELYITSLGIDSAGDSGAQAAEDEP